MSICVHVGDIFKSHTAATTYTVKEIRCDDTIITLSKSGRVFRWSLHGLMGLKRISLLGHSCILCK